MSWRHYFNISTLLESHLPLLFTKRRLRLVAHATLTQAQSKKLTERRPFPVLVQMDTYLKEPPTIE